MTAPLRWDLFCRVIDNHGDVGVCWRLAADLAARGQLVHLRLDDDSALHWMAPAGAPGVRVSAWPADDDASEPGEPGDVVIEAFGCELPSAFVERIAARATPPVWINLEYLSAEPYVERVHRLASPQSHGPGAGLRKTFFYPGFTPQTGGLLREPGLLPAQQRFDRSTWLQGLDVSLLPDERVVSLFCYDQPALPALIEQLADRPTLLLATTGHAARQIEALLGTSMARGLLRARVLPLLPQTSFDQLLWSADLNLVRGEDSFVRAQWAGKPFLWQAYPQSDGVHLQKVDAFMDRHLAAADIELARGLRACTRAWNAGSAHLPALPPMQAWASHALAWRDALSSQADLTTQLIGFLRNTPGIHAKE